jgi:hypothetical protein
MSLIVSTGEKKPCYYIFKKDFCSFDLFQQIAGDDSDAFELVSFFLSIIFVKKQQPDRLKAGLAAVFIP